MRSQGSYHPRMRKALPLLLLLFLWVGCPEPGPEDADGDGWSPPEDCDDLVSSTNPGAGEWCDGVDNDCDGTVDEGYDEDGDGFKTCGDQGDCDDSSAAVNPGAEEVCDNVDNNCDGAIDEGCAADGDGDGWYPPADCDDADPLVHPDAEEVCDGVDNNCDGTIDEGFDDDGDGWSYCGGLDCDDTDPTVHPEAPEVCDGADQDCDGLIDEDFDVDQDGWTTCDDPVDCDDSAPGIHPGAPEQCNGLDDDCDGVIDEDTTDDNDGDGVSACNGDCDDGNPNIYPGALEIPNGIDDDCSGQADDGYSGTIAVGLFHPQATGTVAQERLGDTLSTDGYFNSDTLSDFVSGSSTYGGGQGRAHIFLGESFSAGSPPAAFAPFATVTGAAVGDYLGHDVDLGDINGDGFDDVIIGAPQIGSSTPPPGRVYVFFGGPVMSSGAWPVAAADVTIIGDFPTEQCGTAVAALGDIDGDGIGDLGFTCPWFDPGGGNLVGRTVIFFGRTTWSGSYESDDGDAWIVGDTGDGFSGQALVGDFDMNADGRMELAIGSPNWDPGKGRVGLELGAATVTFGEGMVFGALDRLWEGWAEEVGWWLGSGESDGADNLLIGATQWSSERGILAVVAGGASMPETGHLWNRTAMEVRGEAGTELVGTSAALVDLDGDSVSDLLAAVPGWDGPFGGDQGRVALFNGGLTAWSGIHTPAEADVLILGEAAGDFLGGSMTRLSDFNGDGAPDLLVSAPYHDSGGGNAGRIYFIPGF